MSKLECSLLRINAGNTLTDVWSGLDNENVYDKVNELMSLSVNTGDGQSRALASHIMVESTNLMFWCDDGKTHAFDIFADDDGKSKCLLPNHRVNAMIHAARFTSSSFDTVTHSRNQEMKDTYGSNFFVGDVYIILPSGCPTLDLFIGGDNPIDFIMQKRTPSNQMMQEFGQELADNMINPRMKRNIPSSYSGTRGQFREMLNNSDWVFVDYNLITNRCDDNSYKELLRSWGYGSERK